MGLLNTNVAPVTAAAAADTPVATAVFAAEEVLEELLEELLRAFSLEEIAVPADTA